MSDIFETIKQNMDLEEIDTVNYSPLTFAYIGDAVYEVVIRTVIVDEANRSVNAIHKMASNYVKAATQAQLADALMDEFSEDELAIYKRGRNAKINTKAKNVSLSDYKKATGFEAVVGWLYLNNKSDRMMELVKKGLESIEID